MHDLGLEMKVERSRNRDAEDYTEIYRQPERLWDGDDRNRNAVSIQFIICFLKGELRLYFIDSQKKGTTAFGKVLGLCKNGDPSFFKYECRSADRPPADTISFVMVEFPFKCIRFIYFLRCSSVCP